ncbi:hypothetical protein GBA63_09185 [Rubrobacter tropicus]|uniref:Uncharacterized protein n=1 Tax=Rubrobacter tropicus TaxID=2653851 RepID=A0A6G8Q8J0_9ACTN|nr:hypothetical protein [Rubrobacter tropicus]QIN82805.1 hypothetical protein GBA63_09185 [Rubrobacter tropicus]
MALWGDHLRRTFRIVDLSKDVEGKAKEVCDLLNDCFPAGNARDAAGATPDQMAFVLTLAKLSEEETQDFFDVITCAGGLSSQQAHHLINRLKRKAP